MMQHRSRIFDRRRLCLVLGAAPIFVMAGWTASLLPAEAGDESNDQDDRNDKSDEDDDEERSGGGRDEDEDRGDDRI